MTSSGCKTFSKFQTVPFFSNGYLQRSADAQVDELLAGNTERGAALDHAGLEYNLCPRLYHVDLDPPQP